MKFVAHHLWETAKRAEDPSLGMPPEVETGLRSQRLLRADGPHAPETVRRRLTSWSILTRWPLRLAVRASARPRQRKSKRAITVDVLAKLLTVCAGERPADLRDRALLLTAFASGGRRRAEVAALGVEDLVDEEPVRADPIDAASPPRPVDPSRPHQDDDQ